MIENVWTMEKIRDEMPNVLVKDCNTNKTYIGWLRGRKNYFATVYIPALERQYEYAWTVVQQSLNQATPLHI